MWWKAQKFVFPILGEKLHKNIYVYVQQVLHPRDYLVLQEILCHHLGQPTYLLNFFIFLVLLPHRCKSGVAKETAAASIRII